MSAITDILDTINGAVDDLAGEVQLKDKYAYKEIVNMLKDLDVENDGIINNVGNLQKIVQIKTKLERFIIDNKYKGLVKKFGLAYNKVADLQNKYFAQFAANANKIASQEHINIIKKESVETTINNLLQVGIEAGVTDGVRKILLSNMQSGSSMADLTEQLRTYMLGNENVDGALTSYVKTFATTAINQFSAEYNKAISDDLGLEWYVYVGSLLTTSREFCIKAVDKKYIHQSEFEKILEGWFDGEQIHINKKTDLPNGLMEGTTPENFPRRRGGWNCGHQLIAVSDITVPNNIKDAVYVTGDYKLWALAHGVKVKQPLKEQPSEPVDLTISFAPYRSKPISMAGPHDAIYNILGQDQSIRKSADYKLEQENAHKVAEFLGVSISENDSTLGGYVDTETGQPVQEISNVYHVRGDKAKVELMAAILGKSGPEVQDSVLITNYNKKGAGWEFKIITGNLPNSVSALKLLNKNNIEHFTLDMVSGDITIIDPNSANTHNILNFIEDLKAENLYRDAEANSVDATFVGQSSYDQIIKTAGDKVGEQTGFNINDFIQGAKDKYAAIRTEAEKQLTLTTVKQNIDAATAAGQDSFKYYHDASGNITPQRLELYKKIEDTILGNGSTKEGTIYFTGGASANGKSSMQAKLSRPDGIITIDSDAIKALLPEYEYLTSVKDKNAASFVHEESSYISKQILKAAQDEGYDFIYDSIGDGTIEKLTEKVNALRGKADRIVADYATVDTEISLSAAQKRYEQTGRFIPQDVILDSNKAIAELVPKILERNLFDEFNLWDNNIKGQSRLILTQKDGKVTIYDQELYDRFLAKKDFVMPEPVQRQPVTSISQEEIDLAKGYRDYEQSYNSVKINKSVEDRQGLSLDEAATLYGYTASSYTSVNRKLRGKSINDDPKLTAYIKYLEYSLDKIKDVYQGQVYRVTDLTDEQIAGYEQAQKTNTPYTHKFFTSTAYDYALSSFSGNVTFLIYSKNGKKITGISSFGDEEREVLFNAGTKFKVESVTKDSNDHYVIRLSEL